MSDPPLFPPLSHAIDSHLRATANEYLPLYQVATSKTIGPDLEQYSGDSESPDQDDLDDLAEHPPQTLNYPTWIPINYPSDRPRKLPLDLTAFSLRNGYTLTNAELRMNEIFDDEAGDIDKQDGLVYHQGHKCQDYDGLGSSYSFVWLDDDPKVLPAQVQQWKDRITKMKRHTEGQVLENDVRHMLETGSALVVERTSFEETAISVHECLLSECRHEAECYPAGRYYITLRPGRQAWQLQRPFGFCLHCFERLWNGDFSKDPGPPGVKILQHSDSELCIEPHATQSQHNTRGSETPLRCDTPFANSYELSLDGAMDMFEKLDIQRMSSLSSSRHADPETFSSPLRQGIEKLEHTVHDSPCSVDAQGDWIDQPTRLQHIAAFIKPGRTLNVFETAAVNLWKAASFEQLQWVVHRQKTEYRREYQAGDSLVDKSINMDNFQIEDIDSENLDDTAMEDIVKLPKSRFRGCSLADVWLVLRKECLPQVLGR